MKAKRILFALLPIALSIVGCNQTSQSESIESSSEQDSSIVSESSEECVSSEEVKEEITSLKVLTIGNSFALDTTEHLPNIVKNLGIEDIKFANLYIGGCSINKHYNNAMNNSSSYEYFVNTGNGWTSSYNKSILYALQSEEWDYISIQHGTGDKSRYADIYSYGNLPDLIDYVLENVDYNPKIVFNMTWVGEPGSHEELINVFNNDTQAYYEAICELTKDRLTRIETLDIISPTGTAIQNARTAQLGSLTRDNYHLSLTTGRYTAALTFLMALTGLDISPLTWAPSGMSQYMIDVAKESALNAIKTPYEVTPSIIEAPDFEWPTNVSYGQPATPANPYYPHASKEAPEVAHKVDLFEYFNILPSLPIVGSTLQSSNNLGLTIDLEKTPYLYYSFIIPEGSDFTFSIYSDTTYAPWLSFLDASKGNAKLGDGAERWDSLFSNNRAQYAKTTQTGCIDLRDYANPNAKKWVISMMKLYAPKADGVILSYFFIGSGE